MPVLFRIQSNFTPGRRGAGEKGLPLETITSTQNARVKRLKTLSSRKGRLEEGLFLAEGPKIIGEALSSGLRLHTLLSEDAVWAEELLASFPDSGKSADCFAVSRSVLEAVCDARTPQKAAAAFEIPLCLPPKTPEQWGKGLWAVLDGVQDPGNMGTILRSADAMGACGVLLGPGCADPWSPKSIRSAMGSTFHVPVVETADLCASLRAMKEAGYLLLAGHLRGESTLPARIGDRAALLIGSEGHGLSDAVSAEATLLYRLPMKGRAESLNAAVCAGILLYELSGRMEE